MYKEAPLLSGGEPYMFSQFRVRYPKGSLLTELSAIDHGKYIVRCLVQDEGITLVTSLAAADTVELAEDKARSRALAIIGIYPATLTGEPETSLINQEVSMPLNRTPMASSPPAFSAENLIHSSSVQVPDAATEEIQPLRNGSEMAKSRWGDAQAEDIGTWEHPDLEKSSTNFSASPDHSISEPPEASLPLSLQTLTDPSQPLDTSTATTSDTSRSSSSQPKREKTSKRGSKTPRVVEESTFTVSDEVSAAEVETLSPEEVETPLWMAEQVSPAPVDDVQVPSSFPSEPDTDKNQKAETKTPIDFSEIIARTNVELKRLGWTNQQGRDYLVQTYGKRSRQLLTDEELLDFLNHLESEPTPES